MRRADKVDRSMLLLLLLFVEMETGLPGARGRQVSWLSPIFLWVRVPVCGIHCTGRGTSININWLWFLSGRYYVHACATRLVYSIYSVLPTR